MDVARQRDGNKTTDKLLGGCTGKGFMPGQSGNPGGPKPGRTLTARLRHVLELNDGEARKALIRAGVIAALGDGKKRPPDFRFWNAIFERIDGKIMERVGEEGLTADFLRAQLRLMDASVTGERDDTTDGDDEET